MTVSCKKVFEKCLTLYYMFTQTDIFPLPFFFCFCKHSCIHCIHNFWVSLASSCQSRSFCCVCQRKVSAVDLRDSLTNAEQVERDGDR